VIFNKVHLDPESFQARLDLAELFGASTEIISLGMPKEEPSLNLISAPWMEALAAADRSVRLKSRLILAGALYLFIILCAVGNLLWMNSKVKGLEVKLRAINPEVASIKTRSSRWNALAPAIDPSRYTVELLYQIQKSMPSDSIRITQFDQQLNQFEIEGEAPKGDVWTQYCDQLKANPDLKDFSFETPQPAILPNDHAQFKIFGKL